MNYLQQHLKIFKGYPTIEELWNSIFPIPNNSLFLKKDSYNINKKFYRTKQRLMKFYWQLLMVQSLSTQHDEWRKILLCFFTSDRYIFLPSFNSYTTKIETIWCILNHAIFSLFFSTKYFSWIYEFMLFTRRYK